MAEDTGGGRDWSARLSSLARGIRQSTDVRQAGVYAAQAIRLEPSATAFVLAGGGASAFTLLASDGPLAATLGSSLESCALLFPEWLVHTGSPVVIPDLGADPRASCLRNRGVEASSVVLTPFVGSRCTLGILVLFCPQRGEPLPEDLAGIQAVADMFGMALEKERLRETAEEQVRQLQALGHVNRRLITEVDAEALLTLISDVAASLFRLDLCCLMMYDGGGDLRVRAARGLTAEEAEELVFADDEPPDAERFRALGFVSVVMHRVVGRERTLGYLVAGCRAARPLDGSERSPLATWASLAGVALENSRWMAEAEAARQDTIDALVAVLETREPQRSGTVRTRAACVAALAGNMGLTEQECRDLYLASLLADAEIVSGRSSLPGSASPRLQRVHRTLQGFRERWDGGGPLGLRGSEIPLGARILAVVWKFTDGLQVGDWVEFLSSAEALRRVREEAGRSLDPTVVAALESLCRNRLSLLSPGLSQPGVVVCAREGLTSPAHKLAKRVEPQGKAATDASPLKSLALLTLREQEILEHVAQGLSNREIAARLFLSEATVKTHVSRILQKLGLPDRTKAAVYMLKARE